jgi:hypothetical protein
LAQEGLALALTVMELCELNGRLPEPMDKILFSILWSLLVVAAVPAVAVLDGQVVLVVAQVDVLQQVLPEQRCLVREMLAVVRQPISQMVPVVVVQVVQVVHPVRRWSELRALEFHSQSLVLRQHTPLVVSEVIARQVRRRQHLLQRAQVVVVPAEMALALERLVVMAVMVEVASLLFVTQPQHHVRQRRLGSVPMLL